jgi:hypothetical protein
VTKKFVGPPCAVVVGVVALVAGAEDAVDDCVGPRVVDDVDDAAEPGTEDVLGLDAVVVVVASERPADVSSESLHATSATKPTTAAANLTPILRLQPPEPTQIVPSQPYHLL